MIKKSLKILFRNCNAVYIFFLSFVLHLFCILMFAPLYIEILPDVSIVITLFLCLAALLVVSTMCSALIYPIALNRIYESVRGILSWGCAKRGLKKNWWKTFSATRVIHLPAVAVFLIIFFAIIALVKLSASQSVAIIVMSILFFFLFIPWVMFAVICFASVTAHDDFHDGMKNVAKLGFVNYIKIYGVHLLGCIPPFIVGLIYKWYYNMVSTPEGTYTYHFLNVMKREEVLINTTIALVVFVLTVCIGLVFALIYTNYVFIEYSQSKIDKQSEIKPT